MSTPLVTPNLLAQMKQAQGIQALAAPVAPPVSMPAPALAISAPSLPSVVNQPSPSDILHRQLNTDQAELNRRVNTGSGIDQIHNPLLKGIARAGDIAASVFGTYIPGVRTLDAVLPGTTLHHQIGVAQQRANVANDQASLTAQAKQGQEEALTEQEQAKADSLRNPQKAIDASKTVQTDDGVYQLNPDTGKYDVRVGDKPDKPVNIAQLHANAVQKAIQEGRDPSQDPTVNHLANAIIGLQPGQNKSPVLKESQPIIGADGKPHVYELDEQGNKVKDLGIHYERPMSVNVNAGLGALDRETKQFGAPYQKSLDASNGQLEKIADARAMINGNAESQGLGIPKVLTALVGGQGTGVRITTPELNAIAHARGLSGDVEGTLSKWAGKGQLTKTQQAQLTQIMDDVKARLLQKQTIASQTLDAVNGASSRDEIIAADKAARKQLSDLESNAGTSDQLISVQIPGQPPGQIHASQKAAFLAKYPNAKVGK